MMANDGTDPETPGTTDHRGTYEGFMAAAKWGVIVVATALVLMAIFLV